VCCSPAASPRARQERKSLAWPLRSCAIVVTLALLPHAYRWIATFLKPESVSYGLTLHSHLSAYHHFFVGKIVILPSLY
jgi:hypothetical protein